MRFILPTEMLCCQNELYIFPYKMRVGVRGNFKKAKKATSQSYTPLSSQVPNKTQKNVEVWNCLLDSFFKMLAIMLIFG